MTEEEKEICIGKRSGKTYNKIQEMAKEIVRLQKENQELKERNKHQYELLGKFENYVDKETIMKIYDEE